MEFHSELCNKWQSRLLRWSLLAISWTTYILYRSLVVGQMKYDTECQIMVIRPRHILTTRIALILKAFLLLLDYLGVHYFFMVIYPFLTRLRDDEKKKEFFEDIVEAVAYQICIWNICRLYCWLRSLSWNRSFVRLVNEVIHVMSLVEATLGPLPLEGIFLLIIYVIQLELTLLQLINNIRERLHIFVLNTILIEMFYNTYVAYLLLVLSWLALFNRFFESHLMLRSSTRQQRQKILRLLELYSRINNGHQNILVLWLPVASVLLSNIVLMVCHWAAIIYIVLFNHDLDTIGKFNWVVKGHLGVVLAPFLRILLIGLCNDRLAELERFLSLQLLVIDLRHSRSAHSEKSFARKFTKLQTCFDLQLRVQPIRTAVIVKHQVCSSSYVLEYMFCILVNALNYVQYGVSNETSVYNFHQTRYIIGEKNLNKPENNYV